jgi:membrane protein implicated in regulation of membrane protease activity
MGSLGDWAKPELIWFVIGLVLLIMEFSVPGLIIFFFGVGAWIVALICLLGDISLNMQLIVFIVTSVVLLLLLRRWLKTVFSGHSGGKQDLTQNVDDFIGQRVKVTKAIPEDGTGKVELHGVQWEAESDSAVPEGSTVVITGKRSITLSVRPIERSSS